MMTLYEIEKEAEALTEEQRASLASRLLHGLKTPEYDVSDEEVLQRQKEADADEKCLITFDELVSGLSQYGT